MSSVTDREINLCYRESESGRERKGGGGGQGVKRLLRPALPAGSPADGSAASQRRISQNGMKMVQETSCLKMNAADSEVRTLMG